MQIAILASSLSLFFLLLIIGLIEVTTALTSASLPATLSWLTSSGALLVLATVMGALATGVISLVTERAD